MRWNQTTRACRNEAKLTFTLLHISSAIPGGHGGIGKKVDKDTKKWLTAPMRAGCDSCDKSSHWIARTHTHTHTLADKVLPHAFHTQLFSLSPPFTKVCVHTRQAERRFTDTAGRLTLEPPRFQRVNRSSYPKNHTYLGCNLFPLSFLPLGPKPVSLSASMLTRSICVHVCLPCKCDTAPICDRLHMHV